MTRTLLALAFLLLPRLASAACALELSPLVFGRYDVFDPSPVDTTATLSWSCTSDVMQARVRVSRGTNRSAREHTLDAGIASLAYRLYLDAARTRVWGDETEGTEALFVSGEGSTTIFARIPARQNVPVGSYSDAVHVAVDF